MNDRDDEIQRLQRELKVMRERDEDLRRDQRDTSYDEYLRLCPKDLFAALKVQDKSKSSGGGTTNVTGKHYPLWLQPWRGFVETQKTYHDIIEEILQNDSPLPSRLAVRAIAQTANKRPVASEDDLRTFEHLAVEDPVENVFAALGPRSQDHPIGQELDCKAMTFENHPSEKRLQMRQGKKVTSP